MSVNIIIESINLSINQLQKFLLDEIQEFMEAENLLDAIEEFGDILFSLRVLYFAKTQAHCDFSITTYEMKLKKRLSAFGTISKIPAFIPSEITKKSAFSLIHFYFTSSYNNDELVKNGTEVEILKLIESQQAKSVNQLIITFGYVEKINVKIIKKNKYLATHVVLVQIPNFIFSYSKKKQLLSDAIDLITSQVFSAVLSHTEPP